MYMDFLTDRCDIYHLRREQEHVGYGVPPDTAHTYPKEPDEADVPCHFNRGGLWAKMVQTEPGRMYPAATKLQLPLGIDVRLNDRIIDCSTGLVLTAGVPRVVGRNHHIAVEAQAIGAESEL